MDNSIYKKCTECGQTKHISEFSKSYPNRCKTCVAEHTRKIPGTALEFEKAIDWEQRRYELAKSAMQGRLSNQYGDVLVGERDFEEVAVSSVEFADALIAELKKGGKG